MGNSSLFLNKGKSFPCSPRAGLPPAQGRRRNNQSQTNLGLVAMNVFALRPTCSS